MSLLPYGIIVNAIAPGRTATKMMSYTEGMGIENPKGPCGRLATPDEIASLPLMMLISDLIIGETYFITGGVG